MSHTAFAVFPALFPTFAAATWLTNAFWIYLGVVALASILLTCYDKLAAKGEKARRIPEASLMWLGAIGGALPMFIMMQLIRHKTQHKKFMIGLPLLILLHIALVVLYFWLRHKLAA